MYLVVLRCLSFFIKKGKKTNSKVSVNLFLNPYLQSLGFHDAEKHIVYFFHINIYNVIACNASQFLQIILHGYLLVF